MTYFLAVELSADFDVSDVVCIASFTQSFRDHDVMFVPPHSPPDTSK